MSDSTAPEGSGHSDATPIPTVGDSLPHGRLSASEREGMPAQNRLAVVEAVVLSTLAVMPVFLVGAMAPGIRAELAFGPARLGLAVAWFFTAAAVGAIVLGRLADRLDTRTALVLGAVASGVSLLVVAAATGYGWVLAALTVGGLANALCQPAVNASLSRRIPSARLGLAFGIKQSAIPAATLLGGLAVPTLGVTLGWRGTFVTAGAVALLGGIVVRLSATVDERRSRPPKRSIRESQPELRSLMILTLGGTFAAAAATSLGAFLIDAAVEGGISNARAGLVAAAASACGLTTRVGLGWWVDQHPTQSRYRTITGLLLFGVPGFLLLASGSPLPYLLGALLGYVGGWSWTGLFHYTVVSQNPGAPATATGLIQTGLSLGAGLGPLLLGNVAERTSYPTAWVTAGMLSLVGALLFEAGRHHLRRTRSNIARAVAVPALPRAAHWEPRNARVLSEGVASSEHQGEAMSVTFLRISPGRQWRSRSRPEEAVVFVVQGELVELDIGTIGHRQQAGEALALPPNLLWTARNSSADDVLLALVRST